MSLNDSIDDSTIGFIVRCLSQSNVHAALHLALDRAPGAATAPLALSLLLSASVYFIHQESTHRWPSYQLTMDISMATTPLVYSLASHFVQYGLFGCPYLVSLHIPCGANPQLYLSPLRPPLTSICYPLLLQ